MTQKLTDQDVINALYYNVHNELNKRIWHEIFSWASTHCASLLIGEREAKKVLTQTWKDTLSGQAGIDEYVLALRTWQQAVETVLERYHTHKSTEDRG